jgi:hypothetical protein
MSHTCSICLDEIDVAITGQVVLSCGHQGHLSCISKWFYRQEKSSCPLCRKEMEGVADVWVNTEEDEEDSDDETESTMSGEEQVHRIPHYISFNSAEFNTMLVEHGLRPIPADKWELFTQTYMVMTPEYPNEQRVRMWQYDLENFFLGRGEKKLTTEMWELIVDRQKVGVTEAFLSATSDFTHPLRLPNQSPSVTVMLHRMDTGVWQVTIMNPEEDTGIHTITPALVDNSATKIQAVWRGFKARVDRVLTAEMDCSQVPV